MGWIVPANIVLFMVYGAVPGILLPQQITVRLGEADKVGNLAIASTIGAFAAMLAQPIAGQVSDRTRSRFGRRAPWIVIGSVVGALALVGLAFSSTLVGIVIAWVIGQVAFNFAQGPLSAVLPDRVPLKRRGTFAAFAGGGAHGRGARAGPSSASVFFSNLTAGYVTFAVIVVVGLALFVWFQPRLPEHRPRARAVPAR